MAPLAHVPRRLAGLLACVTLVASACATVPTAPNPPAERTARSPEVARSAESVNATPAPAPAPAPPVQGDPEQGKAWTEPSVLARLAVDCHWKPARAEDENGLRQSPLSCALDFEQSCVPDPCFDADQKTCKPACVRTCDSCSAACGSTCDRCKAACTDDDCRRACAAQCGQCHESCVREGDRCKSGTCGGAFADCHAKMAAEWKKAGCTPACAAAVSCNEKCPEPSSFGACSKACLARFMKSCPAKFGIMCLMGAAPNGAHD